MWQYNFTFQLLREELKENLILVKSLVAAHAAFSEGSLHKNIKKSSLL